MQYKPGRQIGQYSTVQLSQADRAVNVQYRLIGQGKSLYCSVQNRWRKLIGQGMYSTEQLGQTNRAGNVQHGTVGAG